MEIYRCSYCPPDRACGLDEKFDHSYDECHHPLDIEQAKQICLAVNCHQQLLDCVEQWLRFYVLGSANAACHMSRNALEAYRNATGKDFIEALPDDERIIAERHDWP